MTDAPKPPRFGSTVPYYTRYRLAYPQTLLSRVAEFVSLSPGDAVLDLGCGPGLLAVPFAQMGMRVTAIDPEPEMLEAARQAAVEGEVDIDFRKGSSFVLPDGIGPFKLVTIGRAFHWMDRAATLKLLDPLVARGGAVALFGDTRLKTVENAWREVVTELVGRYTKELPDRMRDKPDYRSHEALLLDSPFSRMERFSTISRREMTFEDILGRAYSTSVASREKLGDQAPVFEARLRELLNGMAKDERFTGKVKAGSFTEIAELMALIAHRPAERA